MRRVDFIVGTRDFKTLKAEQFMQDNAFYSYPENTGESIAQVLTEHGFGSLPVVDSKTIDSLASYRNLIYSRSLWRTNRYRRLRPGKL